MLLRWFLDHLITLLFIIRHSQANTKRLHITRLKLEGLHLGLVILSRAAVEHDQNARDAYARLGRAGLKTSWFGRRPVPCSAYRDRTGLLRNSVCQSGCRFSHDRGTNGSRRFVRCRWRRRLCQGLFSCSKHRTAVLGFS